MKTVHPLTAELRRKIHQAAWDEVAEAARRNIETGQTRCDLREVVWTPRTLQWAR